VDENHFSACHYPDQVEKFRQGAKKPETWKRKDMERRFPLTEKTA
jgi:hypothetical protein